MAKRGATSTRALPQQEKTAEALARIILICDMMWTWSAVVSAALRLKADS